MDKVFTTSIQTREGSIYQDKVASLIAPGEIGYLGILANHAPLVTSLVPGNIILKEPSGKVTVFKNTGKGFLEVVKNSVLILLDSAEPIHPS